MAIFRIGALIPQTENVLPSLFVIQYYDVQIYLKMLNSQISVLNSAYLDSRAEIYLYYFPILSQICRL